MIVFMCCLLKDGGLVSCHLPPCAGKKDSILEEGDVDISNLFSQGVIKILRNGHKTSC